MNIPPDPVINPVAVCSGKSGRPCGAPMNPIRIYEGKGARPEMRGSIVQSCSSCYWTVYHTPAYNYEDAKWLLNRLRYPGHPSGIPRDLRPPEARPPAPTPPAPQPTLPPASELTAPQGNKVLCATHNCHTQAGTSTQGSKTCIEHKCKRCCIQACLSASRNGQARKQCNAHSQPQIFLQQAPTIFATGPVPSQASQPATPTFQPITENLPVDSVPLPSTQSQAPQPIIRLKPLAQPVGGTWSARHDIAVQKTASTKNLKVQQHEIEERKKRTVILVVYHTNGEPPVRLDEYIPTFPHLRLSACQELVTELELQENTRIDFWQGSEWITVHMHSILLVEKGQRVLLKIRPSLRKGLDDCPGIEQELKQQTKRQSSSIGVKRLGDDFVSPIKKAPRKDDTMTARKPQAEKEVRASLPHSDSTGTGSSIPLPIPSDVQSVALQSTLLHDTESNTLPSNPTQPEEAKLKQWPFDFHVYEIHNGLCQMRDTISGSVSRDQSRQHRSKKSKGKRAKGRRITVEQAFVAAFPNTKWAKTTFYEHRKLWFEQDIAIRDLFIELGRSDEAKFPHFLDAIDHPSRLPSPAPELEKCKKSTRSRKCFRSPSSSTAGDDSSESPSPPDKSVRSHKKRHSGSPSSSGSSDNETSTSSDEDIPHARIPSPTAYLTSAGDCAIQVDPLPVQASFRPVSSVNFDKLGERVLDLKDILDEIAMEPEESGFFWSARASFTAGSSQTQKQGSFHWNAAYYGAKGQDIIASTLRGLFMEALFEHDFYHPLSWNAFVNEFLLPETLLLLIQDDKHISQEDALTILQGTPPVPHTPVKREAFEALLGRAHTPGKSSQVIDLTDSTPPAVKQEPVDETIANWKGKGKMQDAEVIDLTMDSDEE
ncbi:hypothetical protein BDZ97DRAFT_1918568 [Flammula alnicola]|nr:hypothetical protein BDZ97DRAFT_1918568 [Flammula alnicola]